MIRFAGVKKRFGEKVVLDGVDLEIPAGRLHYVIGTSGAGKSVLMKLVVGLIRADAGRVEFEGEDVTPLDEAALFAVRRRCGFVFQHSTLFDSMSLLDNVALAVRKRFDLSLGAARRRAEEELERVHLGELQGRFPGEVGAGIRKRAAIARTLSLEPTCVIYDEPTTNLDPVAARRMDALFVELKGRGVTQVVVSHDLPSILGVAERVSLLLGGKIHADGAVPELLASTDPAVRQFLGGHGDGPIA